MDQNSANRFDVCKYLLDLGCLDTPDLHTSNEGFLIVTCPISDILHACHIDTLSDEAGDSLVCKYFYDDWYLFSLPGEETWGLLKMREQEYDAVQQVQADGDTPGVTISFIPFHAHLLCTCLSDPSAENQAALRKELFRVTAQKGQHHNEALRAYFISPKSQAPYLIAKLYCQKIAQTGKVPVPSCYIRLSKKPFRKRLPRFIAENNAAAGYTVCDGQFIYIKDSNCLSRWEQLAILATHTGNVSFHSFAAEVVYHARFLVRLARVPVPIIGWSVYSSAIRADMSIDASSLEMFAPFYFPCSPLVRQQVANHPNE